VATQIVPSVVSQSKSAVIPFPAQQAISQFELLALLSLKGRLHQIQEQVEAAEECIKARLESGAELEPGDHRAELKECFRRNVGWKDVAIRLANRLRMDGEAYCARVLSSTKPTRTVSLIVE
jgi:hypothetical protein